MIPCRYGVLSLQFCFIAKAVAQCHKWWRRYLSLFCRKIALGQELILYFNYDGI
jgi:hypothetical protein